ncbi:hypothetical protein [Paractinoplanes durhamensis]|uniref:hypothetical protein n=1 Tax=Paractinoplanes durhamensis TaxID=113563 RepID=UPI0019413FFB|nr:hypothetical protein [Actinoplanes durhamensis]
MIGDLHPRQAAAAQCGELFVPADQSPDRGLEVAGGKCLADRLPGPGTDAGQPVSPLLADGRRDLAHWQAVLAEHKPEQPGCRA